MALHKKRALIWVNATRKQALRKLKGLSSNLSGLFWDSKSVKINNAVQAVGLILILHPVHNSAKQIAKMKIASGLDTR